jgi:hypothetical protein
MECENASVAWKDMRRTGISNSADGLKIREFIIVYANSHAKQDAFRYTGAGLALSARNELR